jgi:carboxypeptidase Taq
MSLTDSLYNQYSEKLRRIADVKYAASLLQWDQETYLPPKGTVARSRQLATLTELAHQLFTEASLGNLLSELRTKNDLDFKQKQNVELTFEEYQKQLKYPAAFVREMSETVSAAFHSWVESRRQNNFHVYAPALAKLVTLKKEESQILGYADHPYNAHLDLYEKGASVAMLDAVFAKVLDPLKLLLAETVATAGYSRDFLHAHYPRGQQWEWGMYLVKELGFDLEAGRQDISEHPFTTNFSATDVRITTRINESDFANMTWSCIHEVGHALYEQGLPDDQYGLPSGEFASLGIHESQSRLWENCVGRSQAFWQHYLPILKTYFPSQLKDVSTEAFVGAVNRVEPSLIRTEADELTYHFHVFIRYTIEKQIISGDLAVNDIPAVWNELYEKYLGIKVPDDKRGCLQDVHWSHGSFGYFPTYSLGSFYAAQFWEQAKKEVVDLEKQIEEGSTAGLLSWLRTNIHRHGKTYTSEELCKMVTGQTLDSNIFINYLRNKLLN